ncbi:MAG: exodeoxyribonuclease III [Cyclonatronaceae bacterium]
MPVTISSINVNGIRAAERKGLSRWLLETGPDIVCLQEIKAGETQIPETLISTGYHGFYFPARKKGYSGVGILTRQKPERVVTGMGIDWIDDEGRIIMAEFQDFRVFSIYAPSGTTGEFRQDMKYRFLDEFETFMRPLIDDALPTVLCGDFNIAHREIDIHNPDANRKTSGFLPEEREWLTNFIESGFADAFRSHIGDVPDLYSWWTYRAGARERNKGWRIDYQLITQHLEKKVRSAVIERNLYVSDHVPVTLSYDL